MSEILSDDCLNHANNHQKTWGLMRLWRNLQRQKRQKLAYADLRHLSSHVKRDIGLTDDM